jgi:hypothetical protein
MRSRALVALGLACLDRKVCEGDHSPRRDFDDKILSLYARGMTVREIQGHLAELYGTEVSPDLISRVTDAVLSTRFGNGRAGRSIQIGIHRLLRFLAGFS